MKTTVHVISHSHWDREWYLPFEHHRARLIDLLDNVLELLQTDEYASYHLDGQMIAVEDYLEIRPQQRPLIEKLVREGKLKIGPWYVLQDTYLTGSESNTRNLLLGTRMAQEFGVATPIGYLPDAFGNCGQMPQLFAQAGMKAAVFGRGVTPTGSENQGNPEAHFPRFSEFLWQSPDGSCIPSIYFVNWYNNASEIPTDPAEARTFWDRRLADSRRYTSTPHLLMMNGCDHQPVQRDLPQALNTARALYTDIDYIHSSFEDYAQAVLENHTTPFEVVPGELEDHQSNGWNTLRNTASARWYIKALNRENEVLLEKRAEPLSVMASMIGADTDPDRLHYAWKTLIQNHPHDSICGCSVDEVHREMESRFHRSIQMGEWVTANAAKALCDRILAPMPPKGESGAAFAVLNPSAWSRNDTVEVVVGVDRVYGTRDAYAALEGRALPEYHLFDCDWQEIPCSVRDMGLAFGYDLPEDRFRQPYFEHQVCVRFTCSNLPAFGYASYLLREGRSKTVDVVSIAHGHILENEFLKAEVLENGTVTLCDKKNNRTYTGLGMLEDVGDVGNEYIFVEAVGEPFTTANARPKIESIENDPFRAAIRVSYTLTLPAAADEALLHGMRSMSPVRERKIPRGKETIEQKIDVIYSLDACDEHLGIRIELENVVKDHRLRILFPTDLITDRHYADSVYDLVCRTNVPGKAWINPSRCDRMQLFVGAAETTCGLGIANRGLYEYEILEDRNTIALTLLRSVGELGDWGVFPTPDAQCPGHYCMELAVILFEGERHAPDALRRAHLFQTKPETLPLHAATGASLRARNSFLSWTGNDLICTCFKQAEDGNGYILRFFNASEKATVLTLNTTLNVFKSTILEKDTERIENDSNGLYSIPVGGKKIITLRLC